MGSIPHSIKKMDTQYQILPELFLRAPYYSFSGYDLERPPEVLGDQAFRNALFLASPGFYRVMEAKGFHFGSLGEKEKHTLYKYYNRMCFRPTPFGSFASFTLLEWGDGETVRLCGDEAATLHLLPDRQLITQLQYAKGDFDKSARLIRNPTLYRLGNEYRYVKSTTDEKGHYRFSLDALAVEAFYLELFALFRRKSIIAQRLLDWMVNYSGCSEQDAGDYLGFLLDEQVLYLQSTGHIISSGKNNPAMDLPGVSQFWARYKHIPFQRTGSLASASAELEGLLPDVSPDKGKSRFYAALERAKQRGSLSDQDREDIGSVIELLSKFAFSSSLNVLKKFIAAFKERFDLEKVPLLMALDPDAGISYGNFGIASPAKGFEDIRFPSNPEHEQSVDWTALHNLLFKLWGAAQQSGPYSPLTITEIDLAGLERDITPGFLPPTLAVMFRKTEDHLLVEHAGGATATALIGRFSTFSAGTKKLCRKLVRLEAATHPGIIFSDIGQLSNTHTDNINFREQIYPFEIPVNVYSALSNTAQIPLEDLLVSVRHDELILESVKLQQRVIPRLSTAYNYQHNELAVFRLLGDLQYQGLRSNFNFNIENYFPGQSFYPRVVFGNTIISPARWHLGEKELMEIRGEGKGEPTGRIRRFRSRYSIPQRVCLGTTDQQLIFDLGNVQEAVFFLDCIKELKKVTLTEYLLPGRSVKTGNKPLAGQFIAFLSHGRTIYHPLTNMKRGAPVKSQRNFLLGDDWLYVKIYCTPESSNRILEEVITPVICKNCGHIATWFFIRYFDKGYHLRLRILTAQGQTGLMLMELKNTMNVTGNDHLVKDYQGDIYRREMERYGAGLIEPVEAFFCAGSELVSQFIVLKNNHKLEFEEFHLALYSTYQLLICFLGDIYPALDFTMQLSDRYLREFATDRQLKVDLDMKFRTMKQEINDLLGKSPLSELLSVPMERLFKTTTIISALVKDHSLAERSALLADMIHMQLNRTFTVKQRQQELLVYYLLQKYLLSTTARMVKSHPQG